MVFAAPQLKAALNSLSPGFVVYPSPQGVLITQEIIETLARQEHVIIICGHYEGIDERFTEKYVNLEVSIGDCVLTGGEIPAMLITDAMSRLVPGVVGKNKAVIEDSFYRGLLDNPNYTRPSSWENLEVPEILMSGNEKEISRWRRREAVRRTLTRRPDLISRASVREYLTEKINLAVLIEDENFDFSGIINLCEFYKLGRPYVIAHNKELRESVKKICQGVKILGSFGKILETCENALIIKISDGAEVNSFHSLEAKRMCLEHDGEIIFVFAQNDLGLDEIDGIKCHLHERDINLPLNVKIGTALDRLLGVRN